MEADLLQIEKRSRGKLMAGEFGKQILVLDRPQMSQNTRQVKRAGMRQAQHVHGISVVTDHQRATFSGAEPETLFAEGNSVAAELHTGIHIQRIKAVDGGHRRRRRDGTVEVEKVNQVLYSGSVRRASRSMLVLAAHKEKEASGNSAGGCAGNEIAAMVVGPAKIVGNGLAKGIAVPERWPGDIHVPGIDGINLGRR